MRASFGQNNDKKADLTIVTKRQILFTSIVHPGLDLVLSQREREVMMTRLMRDSIMPPLT